MKFSKQLATHLTPEWRDQYIDYEGLKTLLASAVELLPADIMGNKARILAYYTHFDEEFFERCELELVKVNNFFTEKMGEARRRYANLVLELQNSANVSRSRHSQLFNVSQLDVHAKLSKRKFKALRTAFSEYYLSLVLLQNFQNLNLTGFRKILKKHDKIATNNAGSSWFENKVVTADFNKTEELLHHIELAEDTFAKIFEHGDKSRAMKRLRVPPIEEVQKPWVTFIVGYFLGAFVVLASFIIYISSVEFGLTSNNIVACIYLHRGPMLLIFFLFLFAINWYGFRKAGVNHILIFELEPRDHLVSSQIMMIAAVFAFLWALSVLGFVFSKNLQIPPFAFPLALLITMIVFLINPFRFFYYSSRMWLLKLIGRVIAAPFFPVGFADFWLGDQLNSLVVALGDYEYIFCFYFTNWSWTNALDPEQCMEKDYIIAPIFRCLPAWFRFAQCFRRYRDTKQRYILLNAGKYATTFPVVIFGTLAAFYRHSYASTFDSPFVWLYISSYVISTVYCCVWDIYRDFGLFRKFRGENIFLRDQILYAPAFYYFAIIEDIVLRWFWVAGFVLREKHFISSYNWTTCAGCLEVIRRYIWNYFRLENEHLYNAGHFRAVRDIFIAPMKTGDENLVQRMMDEVDGVINRKKRKQSILSLED